MMRFFHVPGVEIPCTSIYRGPFSEYHTSANGNIEESFEDAVNLISLLYIVDNNLILEEILFDHLPCLASPDIDLYLEPSSISGLYNETHTRSGPNIDHDSLNAKELTSTMPDFLEEYLSREINYFSKNKNYANIFMNKILSLMCEGIGCSLIELCSRLSSPPIFTLYYLKRMEAKGLIKLSKSPRLS